MTAKICQDVKAQSLNVFIKMTFMLFFILKMGQAFSKRQLISSLFLFITLPFLIFLIKKGQKYIIKGRGKAANIVVDVKKIKGPTPKIWQALAQGGEERRPMLRAVFDEIKELSPKLIRLDHVFDQYQLVKKENNKLIFDFSSLDSTVDDILYSGASPFFSLSYMPPAVSRDGNPLSSPLQWEDWQEIVKKFIEHYSGKGQKNLSNVYYEVWNEPDLFGKWGVKGTKDYRLLYKHAVAGAASAQNVNPFFIGGPALTFPKKDFFLKFLDFVNQQNLRLDFLSWHRYSLDPARFEKDVEKINSWLSIYPKFLKVQRIISEWAIDSENNPFFDNNVSAAHTTATIKKLLGKVDFAFSFEIKDGLDPLGRKFWGRWGILTHEFYGKHKKPRFMALKLLNRLGRHELEVSGEGTWVSAIATKELAKTQLLLTNFDPQNTHFENVPVSFINLSPGVYSFEELSFLGNLVSTTENVTEGSLKKSIYMEPNQIKLIEIAKISS